MKRRIFYLALIISGVLTLLTGCEDVKETSLTGQLWTRGPNEYRPANQTELTLFRRRADGEVLVEYNERRVNTDDVRLRAYFLKANEHRVRHDRKPMFVPVSLARGMEKIPMASIDSTNFVAGIWAVSTEDQRGFKLVRNGVVQGQYALPTYKDTADEVMRVLFLTPAAVTLDAAVVAAVAEAYGGYYGGPTSSGRCHR
jgi:hypothetical protein